MKEKINKTNVARLLDKAKVKYELIPYEVDENDLSAPHVAESLGENIEQVFKTLVLHGEKSGHFVCVIPGEHEVDLKMAAKVSQQKVRYDTYEGTLATHRIHPRGMFTYRHEEAFSYIYP